MTIQEKIKNAIKNLINDFKQHPDKYLTESDVRCFLFNELMKVNEFSVLKNTLDTSNSTPTHTEVRWYGESGKLKWRSDIVIFDVSSLRVKDNIFKLPSKGFSFNKPWAVIEIKFRRINGESNKKFVKKILEDAKKLSNISAEVTGDYFCHLVALDKREDIRQKMPAVGNSNICIYYKFANSESTKNELTR